MFPAAGRLHLTSPGLRPRDPLTARATSFILRNSDFDCRTLMLTSEALSKRAAAVTPGGVHSNVRLAGPRAFIARGDGARIWDVDGKEYIDYLLGQGPSFLGHAPADVDDAVSSACRDGIVFGGQHPTEVEAAEAVISALRWPDMVRFTSTGTEAVQATVRLAPRTPGGGSSSASRASITAGSTTSF